MCGGIGVDVDTVWNEDETVLASRLVGYIENCMFIVEVSFEVC